MPTGFLPDEDQGYFITSFQLPDGASLERTDEVAREVERILLGTPGIVGINLFGGFDALTGTFPPNVGSVFVTLAPWDERGAKGQSLDAIFADGAAAARARSRARACFALNPAPIRGLSRDGRLRVPAPGPRRRHARASSRPWPSASSTRATRSPELRNLFTSFRPNVPQIFVDLDRAKAKTLGVRVSDVFETLQTFMGGLYVNDFDRFGRLFRVYAQAEGDLRAKPEDVQRLWVRSERGEMVPLSTLLSLERIAGPRDIPHYNVYRSAKIQGEAAPGYSSGQALDRMEEIAREVMPPTMSFEWTGTAYQERQAGQRGAASSSALSLLVVFLFLAAQYESWSLPLRDPARGAARLPRRARRAGAARARERPLLPDRPGDADRARVSKNSILIVEFAKRRRAEGASLVDAAREAAEIRFRPVLMTAFAFILGVVPLVIATRRGRRGAPLARHGGLRRHARRDAALARAGAGALRDRAGRGGVDRARLRGGRGRGEAR